MQLGIVGSKVSVPYLKGWDDLNKTRLVMEAAMSDLKKSDCISVIRAQQQLGIARNTLESYINVLNIVKHRFPLDTRAYITKSDFERVQQFKAEQEEEF